MVKPEALLQRGSACAIKQKLCHRCLKMESVASVNLKSVNSRSNSITLISVHDDLGLNHARSFVGNEAVQDYLRELSAKELRPAMKLLDKMGVKHDIVIKTGHVSQEIVAFADGEKFDLVVLGSKGRGALADLLIGSVAQRVLTTAKLPVTIIK